MKKLGWVLMIAFALVLSACSSESSGDASGTGDDPDKPTIAMTVINQEALFFTEMVKGAEEMADELGVNLHVYNANNKQVDQYNAIENFISEGADALIINAIDAGSLLPVVEKAESEGIPVISVDSVIQHDSVDVQIGVDNSEESIKLGEYFNEYANENFSDGAKLGVVGALNAFVQVNRQDSFLETVESNGINVVDIVDSENVQEKALTASEDLLISNSDMDAVFVTGEPAFIGAVSAVRTQNMQDKVKLFGWDLSPQVVQGIDEGFVEAVIQQHPDQYGAESVSAAINIINGEEVESLIDVPATIVTKDNVDEFRSLFE
ncbi:substrate-binding domain-containing protein [Oceanobacillus salinisoli]|uniref:substrate-binding domain-containing protein n=1 Tax=Oceanobacillus salinisoli TaxID=2678611 RepID=UPI0012E2F5EF|nr:substrate-binding domain-containing protein [Oceanobacillus salinisoli]